MMLAIPSSCWLIWPQGLETLTIAATTAVNRCFFMSARQNQPKGSVVRVGAKLSVMGVDENETTKPFGGISACRFFGTVSNYPTPSKVSFLRRNQGGHTMAIKLSTDFKNNFKNNLALITSKLRRPKRDGLNEFDSDKPEAPQKTLANVQANNPSLGKKMVLIAVLLGCISLWMNISFGYSIGTDTASRLAMAGQYLSFDLAKLIALGIIGFAWAKRSYAIACVFAVVFVLTVGFSLISSQSFMAKLLHGQKVERVMQSDAYQDNQRAKQRAQEKVEFLAISPAEVKAAQAKVERLERQQAAASATYENYASRGNYPTRARQALSELNSIEAQLEKQQDIVSQGSAYNGALSNLSRLESKKFTGSMIAGDTGENAGFSSVAFAVGLDVKTFIARLLLFMAIASEIITTMFFFYAGHVMGIRVRRYTHNEIIQMHLQVAEEEEQRAAIRGYGNQNKEIDPEDIEQVELPAKDKKAIGAEYICCEDDCINTFTARTVWHKRCDACREENSKKHRRGKR